MRISQYQSIFKFQDDSTDVKEFPNGVYLVKENMFGTYFEKTDDIILPEKIYSNDEKFVEHVIHTWNNNDGSMGVYMVGKKGLGKSFTSSLICKKVNIPVFKISGGISKSVLDDLNKIKQNHIIFIDEFEKNFNEDSSEENIVTQQDFLSFLDNGSLLNSKRLFIINSNEMVNQYFINRPSRLRYVREYESLDENVAREIINDRLENSTFLDDILENIELDQINIDILIKIIDEINIHNKPYSSFKEFFNFKIEEPQYNWIIESGSKIFFVYENDYIKKNLSKYISQCKNSNTTFFKQEIPTINRRIDYMYIGDDYIKVNVDPEVPFLFKDKVFSFGICWENEEGNFVKGTFKIERIFNRWAF